MTPIARPSISGSASIASAESIDRVRKPWAIVPPKGDRARRLRIDMDELPVFGNFRESVDALLVDREPARDAGLGPGKRDEFVDRDGRGALKSSIVQSSVSMAGGA